MKRFIKIPRIAILIILLILNLAEVILQSYCLIHTIENPGPHLFQGTATDFAGFTIMFIVFEVILIIAIIRLFAKKSVQLETSINKNGDNDEEG